MYQFCIVRNSRPVTLFDCDSTCITLATVVLDRLQAAWTGQVPLAVNANQYLINVHIAVPSTASTQHACWACWLRDLASAALIVWLGYMNWRWECDWRWVDEVAVQTARGRDAM